MSEEIKNAKETPVIAKNTVKPFDYLHIEQCAYFLRALPAGGKTDARPSHAVLEIRKNSYDDVTGKVDGNCAVGTLKRSDGRVLLVSWESAARKGDSKATWAKVETAIMSDPYARGRLRKGAGLSPKTRIPLEIADALDRVRSMKAEILGLDRINVPREEMLAGMRGMYGHLAAYLTDELTVDMSSFEKEEKEDTSTEKKTPAKGKAKPARKK